MYSKFPCKLHLWEYQSGVSSNPPPWRIKIVLASLRIILRDESQTVGNSPLRSSSPTLNLTNQPINQHMSWLAKFAWVRSRKVVVCHEIWLLLFRRKLNVLVIYHWHLIQLIVTLLSLLECKNGYQNPYPPWHRINFYLKEGIYNLNWPCDFFKLITDGKISSIVFRWFALAEQYICENSVSNSMTFYSEKKSIPPPSRTNS